ncbi:SIS domain-containing protein [Pelomonas sp. Root1444]|uniref:D-sedoheptulose-7-phosphate isomerase n=1 Tax=Pelomonas sp. Root1444 TaxID=1736464 RepID=UPI0009E836AE|nr:SIS domain-containing protein [Pelomonas sp. Root1444]
MATNFTVSNYLAAHARLAVQLNTDAFQQGIDMVKAAFDSGKKILTCGNGGSASTASHYITDWNKMVNLATGRKFRGVCLCDNMGLITAYGNDLSYADVFAGQVDALMDEGDLLIAVSGSGNSPNVLKAIESARRAGGKVLGVVGYDGGKMMPMCDHSVWVNSFDMQMCEDVHLMFGHMVMKTLCSTPIKE